MKLSGFQKERLACAWFFGCIGLIYGIFTGRLPALKAMTGANDAQIGFLLLAFGIAGFCGLLSSGLIIERFGPRLIAALTTLFATVALIIASLAFSYWQLVAFSLLAGLGNGLCDVAMNAQGMAIERRYNKLCMSSLHASFSLGGVLGSLSGSLFAALNLSPFWNFLVVSLIYFLFWPWAWRNTTPSESPVRSSRGPKIRIPGFVYFLGLMAMLCYVSEGSVGEWGSVLLHSVKNASQEEAALVFACFSTTMVIGRFFGDRARAAFGEFRLIILGSLLSGLAMMAVLLARTPALCLCAYAVMGIGFAPVVPIIYSVGGRIPDVSPGRVSSAISILAYSGLLFFPPFLGMLGQAIGLDNALWAIVITCFGVTFGSLFLRPNLKK